MKSFVASVLASLGVVVVAHAAPPHEWWHVVSISNDVQSDIRLVRTSSTELAMAVGAKGPFRRYRLADYRCEGRVCYASTSEGPLELEGDTAGRARLTVGGKVVLLKSEHESSRIEAAYKKSTPPADVCAKAEACCRAAFPALDAGATCDPTMQFGKTRVPEACQGFLETIPKVFAEKKIRLVRACR